ncbi:unnamed protein product [Allacma fusca]|nr:unnamed protein product [Allacma fusca]
MRCFKIRGRQSKPNKVSSTVLSNNNNNDRNCEHQRLPPPTKIASKASVKHLARLFKELECPVCYNTCVPPIETCKNGHIICASCRAHMTDCPTCREKFTGTRNFFAENFISQYGQHCRFKEDGCDYLRWKGENMSPHEATCQFRNIKCIVPSCTKSLQYRTLLEHLTHDHCIAGSNSLPACITYDILDPIVSTRKWLPYYIQFFENIFYVMMEVHRPCFYIWVWVQETKKESANNDFMFIVSIRFQNSEKTVAHTWEGPVHSIRTTADEIKKGGLCLIIQESVMQHFERDSHISMILNIEKRRRPIVESLPITKENSVCELPNDVLNITPENPFICQNYPNLNVSRSSDNFFDNNANNIGPFHSPR